MYIELHVKYQLFLSNPVTSRHISEKYSNIKFHENPPTWSRVVHAGGLLVAFGNFANAQVREFVSKQFTTEALEAADQNLALWNYSNGVYHLPNSTSI